MAQLYRRSAYEYMLLGRGHPKLHWIHVTKWSGRSGRELRIAAIEREQPPIQSEDEVAKAGTLNCDKCTLQNPFWYSVSLNAFLQLFCNDIHLH